MTRDEIQELIEYLEKNYYVKCVYVPKDTFSPEKLLVYSMPPPIVFKGLDFDSKNIRGKLNALDLIRF